MSIYEARVSEILEVITKAALIEGRIPTPNESIRALKKIVQASDPSAPRMQLRYQGYRAKFDRSAFNQSAQEALEDLELLYAESVDTMVRTLNGLNADDINYKALSYQLAIIDDLLENLLLAQPGASGYFFSVYDSFNDLSKVDLDETTAEVDLNTGSARLAIAGGVNKMDLGFMQGRLRTNINHRTAGKVIKSSIIDGTRFGNLFNDIIGDAWAVEIQTDKDDLAIEFSIPVATAIINGVAQQSNTTSTLETIAAQVSRIEIDPLSVSPMLVDVYYSLDGQNFIRLPGYTESREIASHKISYSFEPTLIKFLRFGLRKSPDQMDVADGGNPKYTYVFGLKTISLYNSGFSSSGVLQSLPLEPDGPDDLVINKVSLDVNERVPAGTNINYWVGLGDTGSWMPITPSSRNQENTRVVEFGTSRLSSRLDNRSKVTATPTLYGTRNGLSFYTLYDTGQDIIPLSSRLFRGINCWRREVNLRETLQSVQNNYVVFTLTDNEQKLYLDVSDEKVTSPPSSIPGTQTTITVKNTIFRDASVPVQATAGTPQENPSYSIRSLIRLYSSSVGGTGPTGAGITALPSTNQAVVSLPLSIAQGKVVVGQYIYLATYASYYKVLTVYESTSVVASVEDTGKTLRTGTGVTWSLGYEDITSKIVDAEQNRIYLDSSQTISSSDELLVSYRRPLGSEHQLITSSVVVKAATADSQIYEAGRDYVVNQDDKSIARIPEGHIIALGDQTVVRVDFQYALREPDLDTYTAFFMVDSTEPKTIVLASAMSLDSSVGEAVFVEDGSKVYDVSPLTSWPSLPRGWRQVTIKSKPIFLASGNLDTSSAIYKALTLTDSSGNFVFQPSTVYFTKVSAFPESMRETNIFKLETNIRANDRSWYALEAGKIIINWDPTSAPDTIYPVVAPGPVVSVSNIEEFELEYRLRSNVSPERTIRLRAVLERLANTSPSITPELFDYNLKFSY